MPYTLKSGSLVDLVVLLPEGNGPDEALVAFEAVLVLPAGLDQFPQLLLADGYALVAQAFELVVLSLEGVAGLLDPGVLDVFEGGLRVQLDEQILQVVEPVSGRHLVQDVNLAEVVGESVLDGQGDALHGVIDVDEGPGLVTGAVDGHGVIAGYLGAEPIQYGAEVAVNIDAVNQVWVHVGLGSADAPYDSLVQLGDLELEVLLEVQQCDVIETLGHMVDAAGVVRVHDFHWHALALLGMRAVDLGHAEAFGHLQALHGAVTVDPHCADVDQVALLVVLHDGQQHVKRRLRVVGVGVVDGLDALHGVGRGLLLGQVHDYVGHELFKQLEELVLLLSHVDLPESDLQSRQLFPPGDPSLHIPDGTDAAVPVLLVNLPTHQVVHNQSLVAQLRQPQRQGPADEPIATGHNNLQRHSNYNPPAQNRFNLQGSHSGYRNLSASSLHDF